MEADKVRILMSQILESKTFEDKLACVTAVSEALSEAWKDGAQSSREIYMRALV